jgi:hypothetical protein
MPLGSAAGCVDKVFGSSERTQVFVVLAHLLFPLYSFQKRYCLLRALHPDIRQATVESAQYR